MGSNARDNTYKNLLYSIHLLAPARAFPQPMIQKEMPRQPSQHFLSSRLLAYRTSALLNQLNYIQNLTTLALMVPSACLRWAITIWPASGCATG